MSDEQLADPIESDEEAFTGEDLQVAPEPDHDPEADDDDGGDEGDYEAPHPDDAAAALPPEPMMAPPMAPPFRPPPNPLAPRDPSEILRDVQFDHLSPGDTAEALRQAGGQVDHSIDRARRDVLQERELASRAVVYREWPEEYQGTTIKGRVRAFKAPFTLANIEDWVATYRGGGKYKIQFYRGDGRYLESKVLDVEGDPILPGVKEDMEEKARESAANAHPGDHEARAALERQLAEERFERRMAEERARSDAQMGSISHALASLAEAIKHKPAEPVKPPVDFAALAASAGPLVIAFLQSQEAKAEAAAKIAREDRKALIEQQNAAEKRMMTMMTTLNGKKETMADSIKAMAELKKLTAKDDDPMKVVTKVIPTMLGSYMDTVSKIQLHKAGVTDGKDDEEFGAKMIVDRVTELAGTWMATRDAPAQPQPQPGAPAQQTHGAYGPAVQQQPQSQQPQGHIPMRGGGAIVTPEQQAQHEQAQQQAAMQAQQQGHPGVQPSAQPQPGAPQQQRQQNDINFEAFDKALVAMGDGKLGSEFAHELMGEEERNNPQHNPQIPHLYFSPRVIQYMCAANPQTVLLMLNPQIANAVRQGAPYQPLLDPIGQQFLVDFLLYFSEPGDEEGGEEGDDSGGEPQPVQPGAPEAPAAPTSPVNDITGIPEEGA